MGNASKKENAPAPSNPLYAGNETPSPLYTGHDEDEDKPAPAVKETRRAATKK